MLKVDFRRMFTMPLLYIMMGISFVIPVLVVVMTAMMDGTTTVNPQTGVETTIEGFKNAWQSIGSLSTAGMSMDITSMCNINLVYFMLAVFVCVFVAADFRSGYAKNIFTVHAKSAGYVTSKTAVGFIAGVLMLLAYFAGSMLGGAVAGLSFELGTANVFSIVMCMLAKAALLAVFVPIYVVMSVIAKQKLWMSLLGSLFGGMLLFMMIPMLTPLDSTIMHVVLCTAGGAMFTAGLGVISRMVLNKTDLVC